MIRRVTVIWRDCHLSRSAAGLSYYLLLSLFPTVVCFSILMYRHAQLPGTLWYEAMQWLADALDSIGSFSWENPDGLSSSVIFAAALTLLFSASAGAFRCLTVTASEICASGIGLSADACRKTRRCKNDHPATRLNGHLASKMTGIFGIAVGYLFATVLFFAVYAAIFLLLLWDELTALIAHRLPANALSELLAASRYLVLFVLFFALCWALLRILPPNLLMRSSASRRTPTVPGALFCTVGLCAATVYFSIFIRGSARYSLVYGSLASMILFLMWLFVCGNLLLLGIAVNTALSAEFDHF